MALDLYKHLRDKIFTMILYGADYRIYVNPDYLYVESKHINLLCGYENNDLMLEQFLRNKTPKNITVLTLDPDSLVKYANIITVVYSTKPFPKPMNYDIKPSPIKRRISI
jgi:hypothetical protein